MNRVRMLVHFGITPYIVFDGDYLPSKAGTEKDRAQRRKESKRLGLELLKVGKTAQAYLELQKSVDVTPEMARLLIEELKHNNINYVVAPYEADSQLVYLERKGIINGILSEDSDLLVFGAKCLITKLDKYGECVEINRNLFTACREVSLVGWSDADFRRMAMISGCDYLPGIGGMGLKTAYRMLRKHKTVERLVKAAQLGGQYKVPATFMEDFFQGENTFLYQWVFCPIANKLVNLTPPEAGVDVTAMPYIGHHVPSDIAIGVANGNLHPHTKEPIVVSVSEGSRGKPLRPTQTLRRTTQTPDGKQMKQIDSFFKPKRTPLAELDPNTFTPSPSQQVLLEQRQSSGTWAGVLAPTPTSAAGSVARQQQRSIGLMTAPLPARRTVSESFVRASAPNQAKRQRLCSDIFPDTPSNAKDAERSRFFPSSLVEPSPSLRTANKSKRRTSHDFDVYSEDSFDEALIELADVEEAKSNRKKKLSIFCDSEDGANSASQPMTFSKSTATGSFPRPPALSRASLDSFSRSMTASQSTASQVSVSTAATSIGSQPESSAESQSTSCTSKATLLSRFSYGAATTTTTTTTTPRTSSSSITSKSKISIETQYRSTPRSDLPVNETAELEDSDWAAMEAEVVIAASSDVEDAEVRIPPKPRLSDVIKKAVKRAEVGGSEDLLVPESDGEDECEGSGPVLNLARFAFEGL